jgi:hypothetical protein
MYIFVSSLGVRIDYHRFQDANFGPDLIAVESPTDEIWFNVVSHLSLEKVSRIITVNCMRLQLPRILINETKDGLELTRDYTAAVSHFLCDLFTLRLRRQEGVFSQKAYFESWLEAHFPNAPWLDVDFSRSGHTESNASVDVPGTVIGQDDFLNKTVGDVISDSLEHQLSALLHVNNLPCKVTSEERYQYVYLDIHLEDFHLAGYRQDVDLTVKKLIIDVAQRMTRFFN